MNNNINNLNIEKKQIQNNVNSFFTKKRIIFFIACFLLTITIFGLTIVFILQINFTNLFNSISTNLSQNRYSIIFLILLIIFPFLRAYLNINYYFLILRKMKVVVRKRDWFNLAFILIFIVSITPSSIGAEPYIIYWLNKRIFNLKKASAIVLASSFLGQASSIAITWPSFLYFCSLYPQIIARDQGNIAFWFSVVGIFMDLLVFITFFILIYSKKVHYFFAWLFNKIKKIVQMNYKSNDQIKDEFINNAEFKKEVIKLLNFKKISFFSFLLYTLNNFLYYIYFYFALSLIFPSFISNNIFWSLFNIINIGVTANNFVPLPGSEGSLQIIIKIMLSININNDFTAAFTPSLFDNAIFIWRFFTSQLVAIIGGLILLNLIDKFLIGLYNKKINNNLKEKKNVLVIYDDVLKNINTKKMNFYLSELNKFCKNNDLKIVYFNDVLDKDFIKLQIMKNNVLLKIKKLNNLYQTKYLYFIKFLFLKKHLDFCNIKIFRKFMKKNNFQYIFDFSMYGYKIFANNKKYAWIQNKSYNSLCWKVFDSRLKNWLFSYTKKIILGFDPFFYIKNIVITNNKDRSIGFNDHFVFLEQNGIKVQKYLTNILN